MGPGVLAGACNPFPIEGRLPWLLLESGLVEPVFGGGGGVLAGVAEGLCVKPVLTLGGGALAEVAEGVMPVFATCGGTGAEAGLGETPLPARSAAFATSASGPGFRAIFPIHRGSSHARLCRASPTHTQGALTWREAVQEPLTA